MTKHRMELFTDGVFAIVLTLLVLDLKVPAAGGWAGAAEVAPALLVHAAVFVAVGSFWHLHHGAFARVTEVTTRVILLNLVTLFWITLLPFCAKTIAEHPGDALGASLISADYALCNLSMIATRVSAHSAIDDQAVMRAVRRRRWAIMGLLIVANVLGAGLAWIDPWFGYGAPLVTVAVFLAMPAVPDVERKLEQKAA